MTVMTSDLQLEIRPYQRDALTAIEAAALRGVRRQVVSLPTGAGKTVIFAHLIVERQTRTLILVHRSTWSAAIVNWPRGAVPCSFVPL